jgi:hypothetical protein
MGEDTEKLVQVRWRLAIRRQLLGGGILVTQGEHEPAQRGSGVAADERHRADVGQDIVGGADHDPLIPFNEPQHPRAVQIGTGLAESQSRGERPASESKSRRG